MRNGNLLKMRVSEIRVNQIRVNQGLGVDTILSLYFYMIQLLENYII